MRMGRAAPIWLIVYDRLERVWLKGAGPRQCAWRGSCFRWDGAGRGHLRLIEPGGLILCR